LCTRETTSPNRGTMSALRPRFKLVYCSATDLHRPFLEKVRAAGEAGFHGISLTIPDYSKARTTGLTDSYLRGALRDAGLFVAEVSTSTRWAEGNSNEEEELGIDLVRSFDARGLNCTAWKAGSLGLEQAASAFGAICDRAARRGVRCHIEFVPWSDPRTLEAAWEVVRLADRPNGGLMFDTWHFYRSGGQPSDLSIVNPDKLFGVQLADALPEPRHPNLVEDTFDRLLPGTGAANVVACVQTLTDLGVAIPLGGEVPSPVWANRPVLDSAMELHAALESVLIRASGTTGAVDATVR
jgi:sugar phosphate isomerase/epimerase